MHDDLIEKAADEQYYINVDNLDLYIENGDDKYLFYYIFDPTKNNVNDYIIDNYRICYDYPFGNIYSRDQSFEQVPLYDKLGKPENITSIKEP